VSLFVERTTDYEKEISVTIPVGEDWETHYVSYSTSNGDYAAGELKFGFHLAYQEQELHIGGMAALNFREDVALADLPSGSNGLPYEGMAVDAAWREPAAARIDQFRKANLTVHMLTSSGQPVNDVDVSIEQQAHKFAFGTAVKACRVAGNNCYDATYERKLLDLDGRGHGFNWVVFENDLKWGGWEDTWYESNANVAKANQWFRDRDVNVRGHALLWPGHSNLPNDVRDRTADTTYVMSRIRNHIADLGRYPGIAGELADWDVLNESVTNTTLAKSFQGQGEYTTGREFFADVFQYADEAFPEAKLYLNDYVSLSLDNDANTAQYQALKRNVGELVAVGAPIDGIGFQAHIRSGLNGISSVLDTYDDFYNAFGLEAKVTEFDLPPAVGDSLAARYMSDFMTATFSHESMTGFLFWNFWDVDTWKNPQANLFRTDWSLTPAGKAYTDLVFDEWWTDKTIRTDATGQATLRGFKGDYVVRYTCNGETLERPLYLDDDATLDLTCDSFTVPTSQAVTTDPRIMPNPSVGAIRIEHSLPGRVELTVLDALGRGVWLQENVESLQVLQLDLPAGTYTARLSNRKEVFLRRLIIQ